MRTKTMVLGLLAVMVLATGCFHHSYTVGNGAPNGRVVYSKWHSHWLFAIIGEDKVDVSKLCPSGNATVRNDVTFINGLIGVLIGIVYYPTTVEVFCDGPPPPG
jgi:hypothetical protein